MEPLSLLQFSSLPFLHRLYASFLLSNRPFVVVAPDPCFFLVSVDPPQPLVHLCLLQFNALIVSVSRCRCPACCATLFPPFPHPPPNALDPPMSLCPVLFFFFFLPALPLIASSRSDRAETRLAYCVARSPCRRRPFSFSRDSGRPRVLSLSCPRQ